MKSIRRKYSSRAPPYIRELSALFSVSGRNGVKRSRSWVHLESERNEGEGDRLVYEGEEKEISEDIGLMKDWKGE